MSGLNDPRKGYALVAPATMLIILGLAAPILFMVLISFWTQTNFDLIPSFSTENYERIFERGTFTALFLKTVGIASLVTIITVVLSFPVAYFIAFRVERRKILWLVIVTLPFWISYLLRIFSWKVILGFNGVLNSGLIWLGWIEAPLSILLHNVMAVIITLSHSWAAFAILPIYVALDRIDRSLLEAAADLGQPRLKRFLLITLPLSMSGIIAASLLVFIPVSADFVTPKLVGGIDGVMVGSMIQTFFGPANDWPLGAAIAVTSIVGFTIVIVIFVLAMRLLKLCLK